MFHGICLLGLETDGGTEVTKSVDFIFDESYMKNLLGIDIAFANGIKIFIVSVLSFSGTVFSNFMRVDTQLLIFAECIISVVLKLHTMAASRKLTLDLQNMRTASSGLGTDIGTGDQI